MKKTFFLALTIASLSVSNSNAQIVANGDFEDLSSTYDYSGTPGSFNLTVDDWTHGCDISTPDIFYNTNPSCTYQAPSNKFSSNRTAGSGMKYVGFMNSESILGTLTEPLQECTYDISFLVAPKGSDRTCPNVSTFPTTPQSTQIELVLRESTDPCAPGLSVFTSPVIDITANTGVNWQTIIGSFSLTSAQVSAGYDRIEVRHVSAGSANRWIYFDNLSITKKCCPSELSLQINCERGEISVINLPAGSTVTSTTWVRKKKITGAGTVILSGNTSYPTVVATGNGWYEVTMTIILADGTECTVSGIAYYSDDNCCQITHPDGLQAWLDSNNNVIGYQTVSACGATFNVPIICNPNREYTFDISLCPGIEGYSIFNGQFNPSTCTDLNTLYSTAGSGTIPSTLTLISGQYAIGQINNLTIYATDPGLTPNNQSVNILWIPGDSETCNEAKQLTINSEHLALELAISSIHPNPANDFTTVSLNQSASGVVGIYSMDGRELTSISFEDQQEVNLSTMDLPNGMYIIKLIVNNQTITKRLIKE